MKISRDQLISTIRRHWIFIAVCVVFSAVTIVLSSTWFKYTIAPDTSSYFEIAHKYASGDIRHAINGYWGPLLSWLLVPSFWFGLNTVIYAKIIATLVSVGLMVTIYRFALAKSGKTVALLITGIAACTLVDLAAMQAITPDLLLTWFTVLLALNWAKFLDAPSKRRGILLGCIGALMYFAKGFGFFLFLATVLFIYAIKVYQKRSSWKQTAKQFTPIIITLAVLTAPFIGLISVKYHKIMVNAAGEYNNHTMGPAAKGQQPMTYMGPLAPPNDTAVSVWEDPSKTTHLIPDWSPLESVDYFKYFMNHILGMNLNRTLSYVTNFGAVTVVGLFVAYLGVLKKGKDQKYYALFAGIFTLVGLGYSVVLTESRYLWAATFLGLLSLVLWTNTLIKRSVMTTLQVTVGGFLIIGLTGYGVWQSAIDQHRSLSPEWKIAYLRAESIDHIVPKGSKVISDSFSDYYTCYQLQLHCYGVLQTPADKDMDAYTKHVKAFGITYFINTHRREDDKQFNKYIDTYFEKIAETKVDGGTKTTVYKLK